MQAPCIHLSFKAGPVLYKESKLTNCLRKSKDALAIGVRLVPDKCVGQIGLSWEPFLEQAAHDGYHQVNLDQQAQRLQLCGTGVQWRIKQRLF